MIYASEAGRKIQKYFENLLERGFDDLEIIDTFMLYVLIKFPEVIEMFDNDSKLPF